MAEIVLDVTSAIFPSRLAYPSTTEAQESLHPFETTTRRRKMLEER